MNNQGVVKKTQADLGTDTEPKLTREGKSCHVTNQQL